jgi:transposase
MDYFTKLNSYFHHEPINCAEISRLTGINERTVQRYLKKFKAQLLFSKIIRSGRPLKFEKKLNTKIAKIVSQNTLLSSKRIKNELNKSLEVPISDRTVRRRLNLMGYKKVKPRPIMKLNDNQKKSRILFCKNHEKLDWKNVVFSDESSFQLDSNAAMIWVKNGRQAFKPQTKFPKKIMVWGAFSIKGKSELFFVDSTLNGHGYVEILNSCLLPFRRKFHRQNFIFQQDNAPCHTGKVAKKYFEDSGIELLKWPANSPDLNPIENLWGIMKVKVAQRNPSSEEELKLFVLEEWKQISQETLRNLVGSMTNRMTQTIKAKGEKIKY